jgi:hypothetical protein
MHRLRTLVCVLTVCGTAAAVLDGRQDPRPATQNPPASQDQDATAKAAERKKHFEEAKKQIENQNSEPPAPKQKQQEPSKQPATIPKTKPANVVFSIPVTMMVGETQRFFLYDDKGNNVTAAAHWTTDGSIVAELTVIDGVPNVAGKQPGLVFLYGTFSDRSAEVQLDVFSREQVNSSTIRWNQKSLEVDSKLKIVPAVPGMTRRH